MIDCRELCPFRYSTETSIVNSLHVERVIVAPYLHETGSETRQQLNNDEPQLDSEHFLRCDALRRTGIGFPKLAPATRRGGRTVAELPPLARPFQDLGRGPAH